MLESLKMASTGNEGPPKKNQNEDFAKNGRKNFRGYTDEEKEKKFCTVCEKAKRKNPLVDPVVDAKHSILTKHAMNNDHKVALQDAQLRGQFTRCVEKNNENTGSAIKASFNPGILLLKKKCLLPNSVLS